MAPLILDGRFHSVHFAHEDKGSDLPARQSQDLKRPVGIAGPHCIRAGCVGVVGGTWQQAPRRPLAPSALPASFSAPRASWCSCPREVQSRPRCPRAEHFRAGQPGISGVGAPLPAGEEEAHLGNPTQTSPQPTRHGTFSEHPGLFPVLNKTPKVKGLSAITHGCPQRVLMSSPQNPWGFNFTTCESAVGVCPST